MKPYSLALWPTALLVLSAGAVTSVSSDETKRVERTEFSAQSRQDRPRPRIRVYPNQPAAYDYPRPDDYSWPGPGAVRHCVDWYATEYRPSGTVVTPQMRCRWVRG